jgi:long-chain acyl-CoA synthetase
VLKPSLFPSVPRLYNKIFNSLNSKIAASGGCKSWLANKAISTKLENLRASATYTHGCFDAVVLKKMRAALGGSIRFMVTGSAPIDK